MDVSSAIVGSVVVISGSAVIADVTNTNTDKSKGKVGGFKVQTIITGFLLGAALFLVAMVSPAIAKGLAALGAIGALTTNGPAVFKLLGVK